MFLIDGDSRLLGINLNAFRQESHLLRRAAVSCHITKSNHFISKLTPPKKRRARFKIEVVDGHNMKCVKEEIIIKHFSCYFGLAFELSWYHF